MNLSPDDYIKRISAQLEATTKLAAEFSLKLADLQKRYLGELEILQRTFEERQSGLTKRGNQPIASPPARTEQNSADVAQVFVQQDPDPPENSYVTFHSALELVIFILGQADGPLHTRELSDRCSGHGVSESSILKSKSRAKNEGLVENSKLYWSLTPMGQKKYQEILDETDE